MLKVQVLTWDGHTHVVGLGQNHTITCSVSSISAVTDLAWIKTTASGKEIVNVVGVDGKFSGGTLSDPSLSRFSHKLP
jgi:hypothetical protein